MTLWGQFLGARFAHQPWHSPSLKRAGLDTSYGLLPLALGLPAPSQRPNALGLSRIWSPKCRRVNAVAIPVFPQRFEHARFLQRRRFNDGPPKSPGGGRAALAAPGLIIHFKISKKQKAHSVNTLLVSPCVVQGATPRGGGGLFFSWHPGLPQPRI